MGDEIKRGLARCHVELSDDDFETLFRSLDGNNSGVIDYSEWLTATTQPSALLPEQALNDIFNFFDADRTGHISRAELVQVLGEDYAAKTMMQGDISQDDYLSQQEFRILKENLAKQSHEE